MITAPGVSASPTRFSDGQCGFLVITYVDAQNSFGATVRERYMVELAPEGDGTEWTLKSINSFP